MGRTTQNKSHPLQDKFDTDGISIGIENLWSVTMSKIKQDFVGVPNKGRHVINIFESPKANAIYEGPISWTIDNNIVHINWVEIPNSLYVPNNIYGNSWEIALFMRW